MHCVIFFFLQFIYFYFILLLPQVYVQHSIILSFSHIQITLRAFQK